MITQSNILDMLDHGKLQFPPLTITKLQGNPVSALANGKKLQADALIDMSWEKINISFVVSCQASASPRNFQAALQHMAAVGSSFGLPPLLIFPYLQPEQIAELQERQLSAIDLCGNGAVILPDKILLVRTGKPNAFPDSRIIRRVYSGDSAIVSRVFLLQPGYQSVNDVLKEVQKRFGQVALSTVSKVLKQLQDELIIERDKGSIRLMEAEKLLNQLAFNYRAPRIKARLAGRAWLVDERTEHGSLLDRLADAAREPKSVQSGQALEAPVQVAHADHLLDRLAQAATQGKAHALPETPGGLGQQARGLLDRLTHLKHDKPPALVTKHPSSDQIAGEISAFEDRLALAAREIKARLVLTGLASARHYLPASGTGITSVYCNRPPELLLKQSAIELDQGDRHVNLELLETDEQAVYFDFRAQANCPYASPLQTWLELIAAGQAESAEKLKTVLLNGIESKDVKAKESSVLKLNKLPTSRTGFAKTTE